MSEEIIKIKNLTVYYDKDPVLWNINVNIQKGRLLAIVGPNGAGKSTLIKTCLDFIKPVYGDVTFFDDKYKNVRKKIAYVPQRGSVDWDFPTTVIDVVKMGRYGHLGLFKRVTKKETELAKKALEKVSMLEFENRQINQLSGGQQQRVFLARALVQEADIYLLDEPFQGVDKTTEKAIVEILKTLKELGKTVVVVHHDLNTVKDYFDDVLMINKKVICFGKIDEIFTKENLEKTYNLYDISGVV